MELEYNIIDTEVLEDYFSLQIKSNNSETYIYTDPYQVYKILQNCKKPMYFYSIDYDKVILNALCKFVENDTQNIIPKLRKVSDYIIQKKLNYFRLNKKFLVDNFFVNGKNFKKAKEEFIGSDREFIEEFPELLGKSKVFKSLQINSIPKIYWYFTINNKKELKPTISLKKLQLINEGYNVKFNLAKYTSIAAIKKDNLYNQFIKYSKNDIHSLEMLFLKKPGGEIKKRMFAIQAVKLLKPDFTIDKRVLYSENDTNLIIEILKIDKPNKDVEIDYTKYIHTNYKKFNKFVEYISNNGDIKNDRELKEKYSENYIDDDKDIIDASGHATTQIMSFDEIEICKDVIFKIGLGGLHFGKEKYIGENLVHLDYDSQYPSIILQYKEHFKEIINVILYEAVYNLRVTTKHKEEKTENDTDIIEGLKLILNKTYGIINSNFSLLISNKNLGRFICLKGQSLLINLADKIKNDSKIVNANTDGIICKTDKTFDISNDGYFKLSIKKIDKIIQNDVNNYIKDGKTKGMFNISIKQQINKNEKIAVNLENAIKLINNKNIDIKPIYFDSKWFNVEDKPYYFTTKEKGRTIVKQTKKPEIIGMNGEHYYFTDKKEDLDRLLYLKYAKLTKDKILNFVLNEKNNNTKYFEIILENDTNENNSLKRSYKRQLSKIFGGTKNIGLVGYKNKNKISSYIKEPIKPLANYKLTEIQNSLYCNGFCVFGDQFIIIDVDIYDKNTKTCKKGWEVTKEYLKHLKNQNTFECWNNKTEKINRKFIFKKGEKEFKLNEKYKKYIEIINKATIFTLNRGDIIYDCNWKELKEWYK